MPLTEAIVWSEPVVAELPKDSSDPTTSVPWAMSSGVNPLSTT
ncbi:MAG: hypothetical protein ACO21V_12090 [Limnohabitans sp.]